MTTRHDDEQRIAKLLARAGVASRREVERMIAEGRVAIDGTVIDTPATLLRSLAKVTVDGRPVAAPPPARLFVYHKPPGLLVTERDPAGRPTIYDRLPDDLPRVVPVGRLDLATEGLLLLTTDGGLKRQLELPATGVERSYRARAYGAITQAQLEELIEGVTVEGVRYGPIDANLERRTGANVWIEMTLTEGKNREVRRVLDHLGLSVSRLIRTRYGPFVLGDMPAGEVGEIRQHDLVAFRRALDGKKPLPGASDAAPEVRPVTPARQAAAPAEVRGAAAAPPTARVEGATKRSERSARWRAGRGEGEAAAAETARPSGRRRAPPDPARPAKRDDMAKAPSYRGRQSGSTPKERAASGGPAKPQRSARGGTTATADAKIWTGRTTTKGHGGGGPIDAAKPTRSKARRGPTPPSRRPRD